MERGAAVDVSSGIYSHSRLWLFESCPEAYKAKYIDKIFPELPGSVEAFLGSMVHESLEWLYYAVKEGGVELDDLITNFANNWRSQFSSELKMNNGSDEGYYFNKGVKYLVDYYMKHQPFKDNTIEIEKRILFPLDEKGKYRIQGYVDRIVFNKNTGEYEVHDYKTNEYMKTQEQVDSDRQLAFYHLGLQEIFGKQIAVKLIWHFLAHNATIESRRTAEELNKLKIKTLELIKQIESVQKWNACRKKWCDWCGYKQTRNLGEYEKIKEMFTGQTGLGKFLGD